MTTELRTPDGVLVGRVPHVAEIVRPDGRVQPVGSTTDFTAASRWAPDDGTGRRALVLTVTFRGEVPAEACVRVRADLLPDDEPPWWLVPGAFYGENRPAGCRRVFPRFEVGAHDPQGMVSDRWAVRADRCATPAVFAWAGPGGVALVTDETSPLGMTGVGLAHDPDARRGSVHLTFPFREEPVSYHGSSTPAPAEVTTHRWTPGERVTLHVGVHALGADRHAYAPVLRRTHARLRSTAPLRPWVGVASAAHLAAEGLWRWHWAEPGVLLETVGFDREVSGRDGLTVDRQAMHVGWVSGVPWAYALLVHGRRVGSPEIVGRAERVLDFVCAELSPSGTPWGVWYRGSGWSQSWSPVPHALHSRTLAEATLFLVRALELDEAPRTDHPPWSAVVRSTLDSVAARQRSDGNLGSTHHALTGEVLSWEGAAGLAWVAALAEAGRWDDDGRYLAAAVRAAGYYAQFVDREFLHGAPEDVDLAPTSEDGYVAVMSYVALHRRTGDPRWLDLARRAADWMLTFRYSYNTAFPPGTILDTYRFATRGADNASPSNQHLHAYGLVCTAELAELSAQTGDAHYVERARETLACFRQMIARFDGDFNAYRGMASERYYQTECFQPKGMLLTLSHAWTAGVLLLGCEEALADPDLLVAPV
ncbi:beta-L-arabinofuranosidase domain-containing protein [Cellulomonas sp. URHB0016]